MSKRAELPQSRRHVFLFDEDWAWLEAHYGPYSQSKLGTGTAVKHIVHSKVKELRQAEQQARDSAPAQAPASEAAE